MRELEIIKLFLTMEEKKRRGLYAAWRERAVKAGTLTVSIAQPDPRGILLSQERGIREKSVIRNEVLDEALERARIWDRVFVLRWQWQVKRWWVGLEGRLKERVRRGGEDAFKRFREAGKLGPRVPPWAPPRGLSLRDPRKIFEWLNGERIALLRLHKFRTCRGLNVEAYELSMLCVNRLVPPTSIHTIRLGEAELPTYAVVIKPVILQRFLELLGFEKRRTELTEPETPLAKLKRKRKPGKVFYVYSRALLEGRPPPPNLWRALKDYHLEPKVPKEKESLAGWYPIDLAPFFLEGLWEALQPIFWSRYKVKDLRHDRWINDLDESPKILERRIFNHTRRVIHERGRPGDHYIKPGWIRKPREKRTPERHREIQSAKQLFKRRQQQEEEDRKLWEVCCLWKDEEWRRAEIVRARASASLEASKHGSSVLKLEREVHREVSSEAERSHRPPPEYVRSRRPPRDPSRKSQVEILVGNQAWFYSSRDSEAARLGEDVVNSDEIPIEAEVEKIETEDDEGNQVEEEVEEPEEAEVPPPEDLEPEGDLQPEGLDPGPGEELLAWTRRERVLGEIKDKLSEQEYEVVQLRAEGYKFKEIGTKLGIVEGSARKVKHRAKKKLAEIAREHGF